MKNSGQNIGKTALVTGAARRIGRQLALSVAEMGYDVALHHHTSCDEAKACAKEISRLGRRVILVKADLANDDEVSELLYTVSTQLAAPDLLINNAAIFEQDTLCDMTRESWDKHMNINLYAPARLSQAFAKEISTHRHGHIINIADQRVLHPDSSFFSYTVSKCALWSMTQMLAIELAPFIRVNAIAPGPVLPNPYQSVKEFETEFQRTPLRRPVSPDDIAAALRFLDLTASITGEMITIDSGQHLRSI